MIISNSTIRLTVGTLIIFAFFSIFSSTSYAQIIVTNLDNSGDGSLRNAIEIANMNPGQDEIVFDDGLSGTISLVPTPPSDETQMVITDDLIITGPGSDVITIDAQMMGRIFYIPNFSDSVSISGLSLINGSSLNGGAILNEADLSIDSCVFEANFSEDFSGGGAISNSGTITEISQTTFINNNVIPFNMSNPPLMGGAILNNFNGTISEITGSIFRGNGGLGVFSGAIYNNGMIGDINNSEFNGNNALTGGAILNNDGTIQNISQCLFYRNGSRDGGAILNQLGGTILNIVQSTFKNNEANNDGGAIHNSSTIDKMSKNTFTNNRSDDSGGAVFNQGDLGEISGSTFSENSASSGGAIYNFAGETIKEITLNQMEERSLMVLMESFISTFLQSL